MKRRQVLQVTSSTLALIALSPVARAFENVGSSAMPWNDNTTAIKKTRSNPAHFWAWSKNNAPKFFDKNLASLLTIQGPCMGDSHPGNITTISNGGDTGFAICDLDDGGIGPLYLDFCRLTLFFRALDEENKKDKIKVDDLFQAYLSGLHQQETKTPASFFKTEDDALTYHTEWVDDKLKKKDFLTAFELGKPVKKESKDVLKYISDNQTTLFKGEKVLEIGYTEDKVGASIGKMRFWVLVDSKNGKLVYELKQLTNPGIGYYQSQPSHKERISEILKVYSDLDNKNSSSMFNPSSENVVEFEIQKTKYAFWRRLRHTSSYDTDNMNGKDQMKWTLYMAYWMGQKHGTLDAAQGLREIMNNDYLTVAKKTDDLVKTYLEVIKKK